MKGRDGIRQMNIDHLIERRHYRFVDVHKHSYCQPTENYPANKFVFIFPVEPYQPYNRDQQAKCNIGFQQPGGFLAREYPRSTFQYCAVYEMKIVFTPHKIKEGERAQ